MSVHSFVSPYCLKMHHTGTLDRNPYTGAINFESELNAEQLAAVTAPNGPALVLAGAGSGKTRTLTYRVAYLLSKGVSPRQILLLTFTNKAAREMLARVEQLTRVPGHYFWGGTFHSIGQRTLRLYGASIGLEKNYTILDQEDAQSLLNEVIRRIDPSFHRDKTLPKAKVISGLISYARNTQQPLYDVVCNYSSSFETIADRIEDFYKAYQKEKKSQQLTDYDDLLAFWLKLLEENAEAARIQQERFTYLLVDEYQDTNALQSAIIDNIGVHHNIMAVGDDAQCIYSWRGANFANLKTFPERHPETAIHKIGINYRSSPQILSLANAVLAAQPQSVSFYKELRAVRSDREKPQVIAVEDAQQQAYWVIERINALIEQEGYHYGDIAILYRAHYQALDMQLELDRQAIPFSITSGIRFFEQAHIKDVVAQLRFIFNPNDLTAFLRFACFLPKIGEKTAIRLHEQLMKVAEKESSGSLVDAMKSLSVKVSAEAREEWDALVETLLEVKEIAQQEPPETIVQKIVEGWYSSYMRNLYLNWQSRLDDLESLVAFASRFEEVSDLLSQLVLLNGETAERSVDGDDDALRLTTIHQAKGLEYPIVFVIGLSDGFFPLKRAIDNDDLEEERRLFYVAITRACDALYMTFPRFNPKSWGSPYMNPSRFLQDLPKDAYAMFEWRQDQPF